MATLPYDPRSRPVPPTFSHSLYIPKHVLWEELFTKHQQRGTKIRVVVKYTKTSYPKSEDEEEITVTLPNDAPIQQLWEKLPQHWTAPASSSSASSTSMMKRGSLAYMGTKIFEVDPQRPHPDETHLMPPLLDYNASGYHVLHGSSIIFVYEQYPGMFYV